MFCFINNLFKIIQDWGCGRRLGQLYFSYKDKRRRSDPVLWQEPLHQQKCQKGKVTTQTTPQKCSIKQQLRTDLGRSVEVTAATQLVWLTWFTGQPFHSPKQTKVNFVSQTSILCHKRQFCVTNVNSVSQMSILCRKKYSILWHKIQFCKTDLTFLRQIMNFVKTYKKRLLLRCIHHFKSDLINNMDRMRISGNEPSSVILSQTMKTIKKLKSDDTKVRKQAEAKRDGVIKPQNYNFDQF